MRLLGGSHHQAQLPQGLRFLRALASCRLRDCAAPAGVAAAAPGAVQCKRPLDHTDHSQGSLQSHMASAVQRPLVGTGLAARAALRPSPAHRAPLPLPRAARKAGAISLPRRAAVVVAAAAAAPHVQLATAALPADVDVPAFNRHLYQWAATLTTNGRNLPFALPLKADARPDGFQVRHQAAAQACEPRVQCRGRRAALFNRHLHASAHACCRRELPSSLLYEC